MRLWLFVVFRCVCGLVVLLLLKPLYPCSGLVLDSGLWLSVQLVVFYRHKNVVRTHVWGILICFALAALAVELPSYREPMRFAEFWVQPVVLVVTNYNPSRLASSGSISGSHFCLLKSVSRVVWHLGSPPFSLSLVLFLFLSFVFFSHGWRISSP